MTPKPWNELTQQQQQKAIDSLNMGRCPSDLAGVQAKSAWKAETGTVGAAKVEKIIVMPIKKEGRKTA